LYAGLRYTFGGVTGNDAVRNALQSAGVPMDSQVARDAMRLMQGTQPGQGAQGQGAQGPAAQGQGTPGQGGTGAGQGTVPAQSAPSSPTAPPAPSITPASPPAQPQPAIQQ
jgi:hypothetical protein